MIKLKLLFLILAMPLLAFSQQYQTFPKGDTHPIWRVDIVNYELPESPVYNYRQYQITGDTVIGQFTYQKINASGTNNSNYPFWTFYSFYYGSLREDTISKKIFFLPNMGYRDTLLYDFTLNTGDTLSPAWNVHYPFDIVQSVDSILIGETYRRRMKVSDVYIIDGIGSTGGLLEPLNYFEQYNTLVCFSQNGVTHYPDTLYDCQMLIEGTEEFENIPEVLISPNPVTDVSAIFIEKKCTGCVYDFIVFNEFGQKIKDLKNNHQTRILIDKNDYNPGMYFYHITDNKLLNITGKFLIN